MTGLPLDWSGAGRNANAIPNDILIVDDSRIQSKKPTQNRPSKKDLTSAGQGSPINLSMLQHQQSVPYRTHAADDLDVERHSIIKLFN